MAAASALLHCLQREDKPLAAYRSRQNDSSGNGLAPWCCGELQRFMVPSSLSGDALRLVRLGLTGCSASMLGSSPCEQQKSPGQGG